METHTYNELAQAIFTVNRHAKTAPDPAFLYRLKKEALSKLLKTGGAKKIGLHFSRNPRFSQQQSDLFVKIGDYFFHMPPSKEDLKTLPHLGNVNEAHRNPKAKMSLSYAKRMLCSYTGLNDTPPTPKTFTSTLHPYTKTFAPQGFYKKRNS